MSTKIPVIGFLGGKHTQNNWYREQIINLEPFTIAENTENLLTILKKFN